MRKSQHPKETMEMDFKKNLVSLFLLIENRNKDTTLEK